jgi:hypothetical protein
MGGSICNGLPVVDTLELYPFLEAKPAVPGSHFCRGEAHHDDDDTFSGTYMGTIVSSPFLWVGNFLRKRWDVWTCWGFWSINTYISNTIRVVLKLRAFNVTKGSLGHGS